MIFWRKKNNASDQEREEKEDGIIHHKNDPALEPSTDYEANISKDLAHDLAPNEQEILESMIEIPQGGMPSSQPDSSENWFSRLTRGLSKSTNKLTQGISDVLTKKKLDPTNLQDLEDVLIEADLGPKTAAYIAGRLAARKFDRDVDEKTIKLALAEEITSILSPYATIFSPQKPASGPYTILVCGVNGVGKTTTIGKMAKQFHIEQHKTVMIAAGDTFRAAAVEQLRIWSERARVPLVARDIGADAAAVAFEAYTQAEQAGTDILLIDTAGRLQNKSNLMAELEKIVRVLKKKNADLPHAVLLVLDATTGQNAYSQVEVFKQMVNVTGLIVTKLDGSAKGGVVVGLAEQFKLPIIALGVGEGVEDLRPFIAQDFAKALVGLG